MPGPLPEGLGLDGASNKSEFDSEANKLPVVTVVRNKADTTDKKVFFMSFGLQSMKSPCFTDYLVIFTMNRKSRLRSQ